MSRLNISASFILDRNYEQAAKTLEKDKKDINSIRLLSLLYRCFDQYTKEQGLIEQAISLNLTNDYIQSRQQWYERPFFDRLEPRQTLLLPKEPEKIPTISTLEKLCIVTGGGSDRPYFNLLVQLLESLEASPTYKNVKKGIIDCGLNDDDKDYLLRNFSNIEIKLPLLAFQLPDKIERFTQKGNWGILARPFINQIFPNSQYYMWLDTDSWVQDERNLDNILYDVVKNKIGIVASHCGRVYAGSFWERLHKVPIVPDYMRNFLLNNPFPLLTGSCFCIDAVNTDFFSKWGIYFTEQMQGYGFHWGNDEITFNYTVHKHFSASMVRDLNYNFDLSGRGLPRLNLDEPDVLYSTINAEIIGIIHLCGMGLPKQCPLWPCLIHPVPFTNDEFNNNRQRYYYIEQRCNEHKITPDQIEIETGSRIASCHFRTLPWRQKQDMKVLLQKEAQTCLSSD